MYFSATVRIWTRVNKIIEKYYLNDDNSWLLITKLLRAYGENNILHLMSRY